MRASVRKSILGLLATIARLVRVTPYFTITEETDVAIGAALVAIFTGGTGDNTLSFLVTIANNSPAGQTVRIGDAPDVATIGLLLNPGDSWTGENINVDINGFGSAAGATVSVLVIRAS